MEMKSLSLSVLFALSPAACQEKTSVDLYVPENKEVIFMSNCPNPYPVKPLESNVVNDKVFIPDINFERSLTLRSFNTDENLDGYITKSEALRIDSLYLDDRIRIGSGGGLQHPAIRSLNGIQHFENLRYFKTYFEEIDTLDVRYNTKLETIEFLGFSSGGGSVQQGKVIVLGENNNLKRLILRLTSFREIDLRGVPNLETLDVEGNISLKGEYLFQGLQYIYVNDVKDIKHTWKKPQDTKYVVCQ